MLHFFASVCCSCYTEYFKFCFPLSILWGEKGATQPLKLVLVIITILTSIKQESPSSQLYCSVNYHLTNVSSNPPEKFRTVSYNNIIITINK